MYGSKDLLPIGHVSFAYLLSKIFHKSTSLNLPLAFIFSLIPDLDILLLFSVHRGPMHSFVIYALAFIPFFIILGYDSIFYFLMIFSHILLDLFTNPVQLFWPMDLTWVAFGVDVNIQVYMELFLFISAFYFFVKSKDYITIIRPCYSNILLIVPMSALMVMIVFGFPQYLPMLLLPVGVLMSLFFSFSIFNAGFYVLIKFYRFMLEY